jgi:hypothetical protein
LATYHHGKGLLHVATKGAVEVDGPNQQFAVIAEQNKVGNIDSEFPSVVKEGHGSDDEDSKKRKALDVAAVCDKKSLLRLYEKDMVACDGRWSNDVFY